jgi:hypothetical protein
MHSVAGEGIRLQRLRERAKKAVEAQGKIQPTATPTVFFWLPLAPMVMVSPMATSILSPSLVRESPLLFLYLKRAYLTIRSPNKPETPPRPAPALPISPTAFDLPAPTAPPQLQTQCKSKS